MPDERCQEMSIVIVRDIFGRVNAQNLKMTFLFHTVIVFCSKLLSAVSIFCVLHVNFEDCFHAICRQ